MKKTWMKELTIEHNWLSDMPYQIKSTAIKEAIDNFLKLIKKGEKFELKYKSRKEPLQSCYIPKQAIKSDGIYVNMAGKLSFTEDLPDQILDSELVSDKGRWFINIPVKEKIKQTENQGRLVSLDAGIRTFITFFSETSCGKIGDQAFNRIQRLCHWLDKLISKKDTAKAKKKHKIKKAINRIRHKISDLVDELHWKTCDFLVQNFDVILFPKFEVSNMVKRGKRKINSKSVRNMLGFSFFKFRTRLKEKALEHGKLVVDDFTEAFTSKTMSWSGVIDNKLGGKKTITDGNIVMDRDINGARGIFLRALGDSPLLIQSMNRHAVVDKCAKSC